MALDPGTAGGGTLDLLGPGRLEAARRPGGRLWPAGGRHQTLEADGAGGWPQRGLRHYGGPGPGTGRWRRTARGCDPTGVDVTTAPVREPPVPTKPPRRWDGRCPERGPPETPKPGMKPGFRESAF